MAEGAGGSARQCEAGCLRPRLEPGLSVAMASERFAGAALPAHWRCCEITAPGQRAHRSVQKGLEGKTAENGDDKRFHRVKSAHSLSRDVDPQRKPDGTRRCKGAMVRLQAPSKATLQGLETGCGSSAGDSRGKGVPQAGTRRCAAATTFASSWPAARKGREESCGLEEQIKAMTDELWQEQLPCLLAEKQLLPKLSRLGLSPAHHWFGHQRQDQVVQPPLGCWGSAKPLQAGWAALLCQPVSGCRLLA